MFGISSGKILGFTLSYRGIEANLEKISVILEMRLLHILKEIQSLTGKLAALKKIIYKTTNKCPFF